MIRIVVGANYGDEGKGRVTYHFSNPNTLNILTNGGAQRGHTVIHNGVRHIFHHIGSGYFKGAHNYFFRDFLLDPIIYLSEHDKLVYKSTFPPVSFRDKSCRWVTPYDVILNQELERNRENKHGSCGMGIWETILRYRNMLCMDLDDFNKSSIADKLSYLSCIQDYILSRFDQEEIIISNKLYEIITSEIMMENLIRDISTFCKLVPVREFNELDYEDMIFENAQGLLLNTDPSNIHTTPSETGCKNIVDYLGDKEVEIIYVTRPYLTRHGAGPFEEVERTEVGANFDETNVYNEFQGYIRYGILDSEKLIERINQDFSYIKYNKYIKSLAITHLDETNLDINEKEFYRVYEFRGP